MNKLKTNLNLDELAEKSDVLDRKTLAGAIAGASTHELLELIRTQHAMRTDLMTAVALLRAGNVRRLH